MKIFYSTVLLLISVSFCFSQGDSSRTIRSVPVASISGSQMISLTDICDAMGYRWQWDRYSQRFSCTRNTTRLSFVQDNRFYTMNDKVFQLPASAVRHGGTLYIPLQAASEIFGDSGETLKLNSEAGTVSTSAPRFSILSVLCDKKQNGTLLTINLTDSLPFDYIYYYPSLTLNFSAAQLTRKGKAGEVGF